MPKTKLETSPAKKSAAKTVNAEPSEVKKSEPKTVKGKPTVESKPESRAEPKAESTPAPQAAAQPATPDAKPKSSKRTPRGAKSDAKKATTKKGTRKAATKKSGAKKSATKKPATKKSGAKTEKKKAKADPKASAEGAEPSGRFFKVVIGEDGPHGRFSGSKPKQAAAKALTSILRTKTESGQAVEGQIKFSIVECTRGSRHKTYKYIGERVTLNTPMEITIGSGDSAKVITYRYNNKVMKDKSE